MNIKQVAILGSGVMGAAIAAHMANAGCNVLLFDIVPTDAIDRNIMAKTALKKMGKANPAPFMRASFANRVTPCNLEDDLGKLSNCDWIVEAVIENLGIKQKLYRNIDANRKKGSIVSSNTSTIPLAQLIDGQSDAFKSDFLIAHFFNPPRYMRLLELVRGKNTSAKQFDRIAHFSDKYLGKGCVECFDSPGFIANRLGTFWIQTAMLLALDQKISVEEADAVLSRPMGVPKTGVFGLVDLVGLDLMPHISKSLLGNLPKEDPYCTMYRDVPLFNQMIKDGYIGRKGKGGFYRLDPAKKGSKVKQAIDLASGDYFKATRPNLPFIKAVRKEGLLSLFKQDHPVAKYARAVMLHTLSYAANLVGEVAGSLYEIDSAMKLGYNWKSGPFELMDQMGIENIITLLKEDGLKVPPFLEKAKGQSFYKFEGMNAFYLALGGGYKKIEHAKGVLLLVDIKRNQEPLDKNASASVWDIGDGVLCIEFTSKMNAMDQEIMQMIQKTIKRIEKTDNDYKALIFHNDGPHFSAGANLGLALFALNIGLWMQVDALVAEGQRTYQKIKYAPFPIIAAPFGMAIGGGCEILLHCDKVIAHAESYIGLVETGVGLVPAWGGCKEMLARYRDAKHMPKGPMPAVTQSFEQVAMAKVGKSAHESMDFLYLRRGIDQIEMNQDRILFEAKEAALKMLKDYKAPEPHTYHLPGETARVALKMAIDGFEAQGLVTPHDITVSGKLAYVLSGGETDMLDEISEKDILKLEKDAFMELVHTTPTLDRIEHMLTTGKPLRN